MPRVLLTRPQNRTREDDEIHQVLKGSGVSVQELPMLNFTLPRDTNSLDRALLQAARDEFDAIILSSPTAVNFLEFQAKELALFDTLKNIGNFGAVGQATADELLAIGFPIVLPIPIHAGSHQLTALLSEYPLAGKRILLLQSQIGLDILSDVLTQLGALVHRETLYYTTGPTLSDSARLLTLLEGESRPDVIAFFSPSSVLHFIHSLAEMAASLLHQLPALACIGETTAKAVEEALHRRPEIVARKADQISLADDILTYLGLARDH